MSISFPIRPQILLAFGFALVASRTLAAPMFTDVTSSAIGMPRHEVMAILDIENDGVEELLVSTRIADPDVWGVQLWKRQGPFQFVDISAQAGLGGYQGGAWLNSVADFNNDGFVDVVEMRDDRTEVSFMRNKGDGTFEKIPLPSAESAEIKQAQGDSWVRAADIDVDGDLDLVFGKAVGSNGSIVAVLNQSRNAGGLAQPFSGVSTLAKTSWKHNKAEVTDVNGDGKPDLLSIRTSGDWSSGTHPDFPVTLFLNSGTNPADYINSDSSKDLAGFTRIDDCGINSANVMSAIASWDIDNDGDQDFINGSSDWPSQSRPSIFINNGSGSFTQQNSPVFQSSSYYHHGISLFDADLDNDMDAVWTQLHNFADMYPRFWRNDGALSFTDVTSSWGVSARYPGSANMGMSGYHADLDGDGDLDFVVLINVGPIFAIYRNNAVENGANWLGVRLVSGASAPLGIGARVEVTANGRSLAQWVLDLNGSLSGGRNVSSLRFGLGSSQTADSVKVYWPSGKVTEMQNVPKNQLLTISEGNGTPSFPDASAWTLRWTDPKTNSVWYPSWQLGRRSGKFLAGGVYSDNGIQWKTFKLPTDVRFWLNNSGVAGDTFILNGAGNDLWNSVDGDNWNKRANSGGYDDLTGIEFGNGTTVVNRYWSPGSLLVSKDSGNSWSYVDTGGFNFAPGTDGRHYERTVFGDGKFLFPLFDSVRTSADGLTWQTFAVSNRPASFRMTSVGSYDSKSKKFLGLQQTGSNAVSKTLTVAISTNGVNWTFRETQIPSTNSAEFSGGGVGQGLLVASGGSPAEVWASSNEGQTWSRVNGPWESDLAAGVAFSANDSVLVAATPDKIYSAFLNQSGQPDSDGDGLTDAWELGEGRYQIVEGNFTWQQAKADAESKGGHLGTFTTAQEWDFFKKLPQLQPYRSSSSALARQIWTGGFEVLEGTWKLRWVTGEAWGFSNFAPPEPSAPETSAIAIHPFPTHPVWGTSDNVYWNDDYDYRPQPYILEFGYPTDPFKADTDGDGYNDKVESDAGTDPNNPASYPIPPDTDGDGILDAYETNTGVYVSPTNTGTDPNKADTDGDGLTDGVETATFIYIDASDTGTDPNIVDSDADGLSDGVETNTGVYVGEGNTGTSPVDEDTSNDGISDGEAVLWKFNPHIDCTPMMNFLRFASETGTSGRFGLFTSNSITDLNLGGLVLQKSGSSVFLRLQLQTKAAMSQSWSNHSVVPMFLDMPGNKAFMRVRALGPQ